MDETKKHILDNRVVAQDVAIMPLGLVLGLFLYMAVNANCEGSFLNRN